MTAFRTIYIDPPWAERGGGKCKRGADRHYNVMSREQILLTCRRKLWGFPYELGQEKLPSIVSDESCHAWIWVTNNFLLDGLELMNDLGFKYINNIVWVKVRNGKLQKGLGQYLRGSHELCLFGVRGKTQLPEPVNRPPTVLFAERTRHSEKPSKMYSIIERVSHGPYLELFARNKRDNWTSWGEQLS